MGLSYNPYGRYQGRGGTTRFQTAFPRTCKLHGLPIHKDDRLNMRYNLFLFYSLEVINIVLKLDPNLSKPQLYGTL